MISFCVTYISSETELCVAVCLAVYSSLSCALCNSVNTPYIVYLYELLLSLLHGYVFGMSVSGCPS